MDKDNLIIVPKRPKGEDGYKVFSIRIKEELVHKLDDVSSKTGRSRNEIISLFLEYAAERYSIESN